MLMAISDPLRPFEPDICTHCGSILDKDPLSTAPSEGNNPLASATLAEAAMCPYCRNPWPTELVELSQTRGLLAFMPTAAAQWPASQLIHPSLILIESRREIPLPTDSLIYLGRRDATQNIYPHIDLTHDNAATCGVSRRHACIHRSSDGTYIEDMGSKNGTFVNGQRLSPSRLYPLGHGDMLLLGQLSLAITLTQ